MIERTLHVDVVNTSTAFLSLDISLQPTAFGILLVVLLLALCGFRDEGLSNDVITSLRLGNMQSVKDRVDLVSLKLGFNSMFKEGIASLVLEVHDTLVGVTRSFDISDVLSIDDFVNEGSVFGGKIGKAGNINFVENKNSRFVSKKWFDRLEQFAL